MLSVSRRVRFCAARRLRRAEWDEAQNRRVFGDWSGWHGHNFVLDVSVQGAARAETGMVLDLKALKALIRSHVVEHLDKRDLGEVALLGGAVPTDENLVVAIWRVLAQRLDAGLHLERITLWQSPERSVSCRGK